MFRRATPSQAAQNQQVIKSLLKIECNKICADCKRNKHPRWASWNLGIFICIRCSGIHRGMGTHISRVKSVDLDSWTDEQLQSVVRWGNARANKYWEAKLAPGHVPSEAKIENFIRTKYESKRWVMDGPMPDPATLDDGDDNVPLAVVKEKAKIERSASQRVATASQPPVTHRQQASIDFFSDDDPIAPPVRPSTTEPTRVSAPKQLQQSQPAAKAARPGDSLLGLDFFGSTQAAPASRPASTVSTPGSTGMSRPDLKQSILSLYSKPQPPVQHERQPSFGDLTSPPPQSASSSSMGGLTDAFSGLSFPSTTSPPPPKPADKPSPFANLTSFTSTKSTPAAPKISSPTASASSGLGGGLFDSLTSPTLPPAKSHSQPRTTSISSNGHGLGFSGFESGPPPSKPTPGQSSFSDDLFGFSSPPTSTSPAPAPPRMTKSPQQELKSAFNLSGPAPTPARAPAPPAPKPVTSTASTASVTSMIPNLDPWGGNAWNTPEPAPAPAPAAPSSASMMKVPDTLTANDIGAGWGAPASSAASAKPAPTVAADEDFGGWASAAPVPPASITTTSKPPSKPAGGFGGADDLFSNVWE
ncbi:stromal membrane-associated protein [Aspergillus clavatus NRRL 1]|uniref:Stromal membrane-associated protein n=1 Tax=Aspergillus clavatus (strain ATCC 1007 / CBS 513.65 / DSM 816 / NCTC 3887 / NRRL 1 / QM 1276 / 107) TaxID=344612 RepID=A1CTG3_ASPCL|nr:stromal membrane-associated protein [Aspergillus clavatus NRRL 1]EAW06600.1 stromal membrane-associated protein [Aspergillus clavatus NRRL 1]